jgi:hypothetical protein
VNQRMKVINLREARCILIPSIATSMLKEWSSASLSIHLERFDSMINDLKMCKEVVNYVRHKPTIDLIVSYTGRSDIKTGFEYILEPTDAIFIVGLKSRTPTPGADIAVEPKDLLVYKVWVDVVAPTVEKALKEGWIEV